MHNRFNDFLIPEVLYEDLKSQAQWHHNTFIGELIERIKITLNPAYRI